MAKELKILLDEARAIAGQPVGDKLDGKQGSEAQDLIIDLLESTGLEYMEAVKLVDAVVWKWWREGFAGGSKRRTGE